MIFLQTNNDAEGVKTLPARSEIPEQMKWDLTSIFNSLEEWEQEFNDLKVELPKLIEYKGTLVESGQHLFNGLQFLHGIQERLERLYVYAHLNYDVDTANSNNAALQSRCSALLAEFGGNGSFIEPELASLDRETFQSFVEEVPELEQYRHFINETNRLKDHVLSDQEERLLSLATPILQNNKNVFGLLNNADFIFPVVQDDKGNDVQLSNGSYGLLMESRDQNVRRQAFKSYYSVYDQFKNSLAGTLQGQIKADNYIAKVRGYGSAREKALAVNNIDEIVYDHLIEGINDRIVLLHRYVALRRKMLGLDEIHSYDLYVPMVDQIKLEVSYENAKQTILMALEPMGEEYCGIVERAFTERWIDVCENRGKRSGAYSSGTYGTNPYILLNWRDTLQMMYTLIHELGHSIHSWYTRSHQPYIYSDYAIFLAEIASTNENLLTRYLLDQAEDKLLRNYILSHYLDGYKATVFRQTQFAEFEHTIHEADRDGIALTADYLTDTYGKLNRRYYGSDLIEDKEISLEWSRVPHFYFNYYVYQYATGFSAATWFADHIVNNGEKGVEDYLTFLKAGSSKPPLDVLKDAGLDMTKPEPIHRGLDIFSEYLSELEQQIE